jgi:plastocyanin
MRVRGAWVLRIGVVTVAVILALATGVAGAGGGNRVRAVNYSFKPRTIEVRQGHAVTWKRVEGHHSVTFKTGSFDKSLNKRHPRRSRTFHHRGTFRYFCRFHHSLGMKGKVVVK